MEDDLRTRLTSLAERKTQEMISGARADQPAVPPAPPAPAEPGAKA